MYGKKRFIGLETLPNFKTETFLPKKWGKQTLCSQHNCKAKFPVSNKAERQSAEVPSVCEAAQSQRTFQVPYSNCFPHPPFTLLWQFLCASQDLLDTHEKGMYLPVMWNFGPFIQADTDNNSRPLGPFLKVISQLKNGRISFVDHGISKRLKLISLIHG